MPPKLALAFRFELEDQIAVHVGVQHFGMDVTFAADGGCIAHLVAIDRNESANAAFRPTCGDRFANGIGVRSTFWIWSRWTFIFRGSFSRHSRLQQMSDFSKTLAESLL
jgi:hypothetical protein